MNVMVIGSGAREHAFVSKLYGSKNINNIFTVPGNAGTTKLSQNLSIDANDYDAVSNAIKENEVGLVLVGPEIPLINGITDFLKSDLDLRNLLVVGPSLKGAMLEGSKDFSKEFMMRHNIPTAPYRVFTNKNLKEGLKYLSSIKPPYVLKADGPAAGKGVLIIDKLAKAQNELTNILLNNKFGTSGNKVVIEGFLKGIELSYFVLVDGKDYLILPNAKDYKRIGEGDTGLNTGGMGSVSPVPFVDKEFENKIENKIVIPTINGIIKDKLDYVGFLFIGLIKVGNEPYVIEYNVRMGDPETQVVLPRIKNDFLDLMVSTSQGKLKEKSLELDEMTYTNVVLASSGYPESYEKGKVIEGIEGVLDSSVLHAGTINKNGQVLTNGGRVLSIVSKSKNISGALKKSYDSIQKVHFEGKTYRKDIGFDL
ncbi:MAG: phosphoribosylamine--glycine ligase [Flavobacteriales bacterium]|nr:phosphoribosylamine--glycine ligase [Flavobacteriales bacterium]